MSANTAIDRRGFIAIAGAALATANLAATGNVQASEATEEEAAFTTPVPGCICATDWLGEAPTIDPASISQTHDYDIVILGGGHAGVQAALAAAQEGAKVAVVEKQPEDTMMWLGNDIACYNSQFMIDNGYGPYETGPIINEYWRRSAGRANLDILKLYVENSGEMFDNMVAVCPDITNAFEPGHYCIQHAYGKESAADYPLQRGGVKAWASSYQTMEDVNPTPVNGRENLGRLTELETYCMLASKELGADWYFERSATVLVQNEDGDVTGAIAQLPDGSYEQFNASKGVLLATGDFSSNADMVFNLFDDGNEWGIRVGQDPERMCSFGQDGTGHKMGCWAGGMIEPSPRPAMSTSKNPGSPWGSAPFLYLNVNGERYFNESNAPYIMTTTLRQPLGFNCIVTDANYMETIKVTGIDHGAPNWGFEDQIERMQQDMAAVELDNPEGSQVTTTEVVNINIDKAGTSTVYASETLEGLFQLLGYEGAALENALASVERYNEICASGIDSDYGKDADTLIPITTPPFYGCVEKSDGTTKATLVTLAGLLTDTNLNVMRLDRSAPIKGLYAAGNCLGGRYGIGYATPSAGNSIGMAMTHGRVAGKIMAAL